MHFDLFSAFRRRLSFQIALGMVACVAVMAPALAAQTAHYSNVIQNIPYRAAPESAAVDSSGNIYLGYPQQGMSESAAGCFIASCVHPLGGSFGDVLGLAVDGSGNVYVADFSQTAVLEMPPGCASASCVTKLGGGFNEPLSLAVDTAGTVYVVSNNNSTRANDVKNIPAGCTSSSCVTTLIDGSFALPGVIRNVALDIAGNLYLGIVTVTNTTVGSVVRVPAGCTTSACMTTMGGSFMGILGMTVDRQGDVYVSSVVTGVGNFVFEIPPGCASASCVVTVPGAYRFTAALAVDLNGNLYASGGGFTEIMRYGVNFFSHATGTSTGVILLPFTFDSPGTIQSPAVVTQGVTGLDFYDDGTGTCTTNGTSHMYAAGETCTVGVRFRPKYAGARYGAVALKDSTGKTIASVNVYGTGTGPQVVFSPPAVSTLGGGFDFDEGVAVDGNGNVYVAATYQNAIKKIPPGCTTSACVKMMGGFHHPEGIAIDGGGNLYVAATVANSVLKEPAGCSSSSCAITLGGGFSYPSAVAVDGSGNVYVVETSGSVVKEVAPGCASASCVVTLGGGFDHAEGVAADSAGNVYVADTYNNAIKKIPAGCLSSACVITLGNTFVGPFGVALDGVGNIYVGDSDSNSVKELPLGCTTADCILTLDSSFATPAGVAVDGAGNVYVADSANSAVKEIRRASPAHLSFGETLAGYQSPDSPRVVTVTNIGNADLTIPTPTSGTNPSVPTGFLLDASTTCPQLTTSSAAATLATGASCTYAVDFKPATAGAYSASLTLKDNALNAPAPAYTTQSVTLSGNSDAPPAITSPAPGSVLGASATFTWTSALALHYRLKVGTTGPGSEDVYNGVGTTATSVAVSNIPANGAWLYVRLYYEYNSVWSYIDYQYTESGTPTPPALTTPAPGSALSGSSATFTWNPGAGPRSYQLNLGTNPGGHDIYNGAATTSTSASVPGIPTNGVLVYVRLYYEIDATWHSIDYTYTEAGTPTPPALTTPAPGSTLSGASVTFTWTHGAGPRSYMLRVGDTGVGSSNIYNGAATTNNSVSLTNVPTSGKTLYVRLMYEINSTWNHIDYTYTEQ